MHPSPWVYVNVCREMNLGEDVLFAQHDHILSHIEFCLQPIYSSLLITCTLQYVCIEACVCRDLLSEYVRWLHFTEVMCVVKV